MFGIARFFLFMLPAELSHNLGLKALRLVHILKLGLLFRQRVPLQPVSVFGLDFPNPVGLAAGLDKNADYVDALGALGFGFIEVGTVTPKPQPGNVRPRLFRLKSDKAIINRMGFNNKGVDHLVKQLQNRKYQGIVGVNIGKNLTTAVEDALSDYLICLQKVYACADYIVVNLSSPNTPGLRSLQFGEHLDTLLAALKAEQIKLAEMHKRQVPLLVKIAPDLSASEIEDIAGHVLQHHLDGVIATNTTISREGLSNSRYSSEAGGLSGAPLTAKSSSVIKDLCVALKGQMPVIGVGGIMNGADARDKQASGAALVQIYSGFIYQGPRLIKEAVARWQDSADNQSRT